MIFQDKTFAIKIVLMNANSKLKASCILKVEKRRVNLNTYLKTFQLEWGRGRVLGRLA